MSESLTKASTVEPPAFRPTTKQLTYLVTFLEAIQEGGISERDMCKVARVSRATSWKWRQDPAFCTWLGTQVELSTSHVYKAAIARHEWLALRGSVKSLDAVTRARLAQSRGVLGLLSGATDGTDALVDARTYSVNLLIQRPDDVASSRIVTNPNVGG